MKSLKIKCDICANKPNGNSYIQNSELPMNNKEEHQAAVVRCIDCNLNLCPDCLIDHRLISIYSKHKTCRLNNTFIANTQNSNYINKINKKLTMSKPGFNTVEFSNVEKLQQETDNIKNKFIIERMQKSQQEEKKILIDKHISKIENAIQMSYEFNFQTLKEHKDFLIYDLNKSVQCSIQNHEQNNDEQLKLDTDTEQRQNYLETTEANGSKIAASSEIIPNANLLDHFNILSNDNTTNNSETFFNFTELDNQIMDQIKTKNSLNSVEFISDYSNIRNSIRNTFGYTRISNKLDNINNFNNINFNYDVSNDLSEISDSKFSSSGLSNPFVFNSYMSNDTNATCQSSYGSNKTSSLYNTYSDAQETGSTSSSSSSATSTNSLFSSLMENNFKPIYEWPGSIVESIKSTKSSFINNFNTEDESS